MRNIGQVAVSSLCELILNRPSEQIVYEKWRGVDPYYAHLV